MFKRLKKFLRGKRIWVILVIVIIIAIFVKSCDNKKTAPETSAKENLSLQNQNLQEEIENLRKENERLTDKLLKAEEDEEKAEQRKKEAQDARDRMILENEAKANAITIEERNDIVIIPYDKEGNSYRIPEGYSIWQRSGVDTNKQYIFREQYTGSDFQTYCPESIAILKNKETGKFMFIKFEGFGNKSE